MSSVSTWPAHLEGACYEEEHGWYRPWRQPDGKIYREPIPADVIRDAWLSERPELRDGIRMLTLRSETFRNLIPRTRPSLLDTYRTESPVGEGWGWTEATT